MKVPEVIYPLHPRTIPYKMDRRGFMGTCLRVGAAGLFSYMLPAQVFGAKDFQGLTELEKKHTVVNVDTTYPVIVIWCVGGPSKYETFRPGCTEKGASNYTPPEIQGIFKSIPTTIPGIHLGELLSSIAQRMGKVAVVDTVVHTNHDHFEAQSLSITGSKEFKSSTKTPKHKTPFVAHSERYSVEDLKKQIPFTTINAGSGLTVSETLQANPFLFAQCNFNENHSSPLGSPVDLYVLGQRINLLNQLGIDIVSKETEQYDEAYAKASALFYNKSLHQAFNFTRKDIEDAEKRYGKSKIGYALYLAARLVQCQARYVVIETGNWDDHSGINWMMRKHLPPFDQAVSAAFDEVGDFTRFIIGGEFGRTPKINLNVGRDH